MAEATPKTHLTSKLPGLWSLKLAIFAGVFRWFELDSQVGLIEIPHFAGNLKRLRRIAPNGGAGVRVKIDSSELSFAVRAERYELFRQLFSRAHAWGIGLKTSSDPWLKPTRL